MPQVAGARGVIGILSGGRDVPGLNPAFRAITSGALREGYQVLGIRRGWAGLLDLIGDSQADDRDDVEVLDAAIADRMGRTGAPFLQSSRTRPGHPPASRVPPHLRDRSTAEVTDLPPQVVPNLAVLGVGDLAPIGGDDRPSFAVQLAQRGVEVVAIPKTMDNDVPGMDDRIGCRCLDRRLG